MVKKIGRLTCLLFITIIVLAQTASADTADKTNGTPWTIYYRPGVRFGTDNRTLYINDFFAPLYRDERNIVFSNIKYTPNNQDGWDVNLGLGYRRLFLDDRLILGINGPRRPSGAHNDRSPVGIMGFAVSQKAGLPRPQTDDKAGY